MSNKAITFKHSGNTGDVIYALAGIKQVVGELGTKADIVLWLNRMAHYYEGAVHPLGGKMLNMYMYKMLKPLLLSQSYIESVHKFEGQKIIVDLDLIRSREVGMPNGNISMWYFYVFPDMHCDLSIPWLDIPADVSGFEDAILVNRTQRYRNPTISYSFLRHRKEPIFYVGTQEEYELFKKEVKTASYLDCANFYDLARTIKSCKVFMGNQSMCYALAEAMKSPRVLEICNFAPNVQPHGANGYGYLTQTALEYYIERLCAPKPERVASPNGPFSKEVTDNTLVDYNRLGRLRDYVLATESLGGEMAEVGVYKGGTARLMRELSTRTLLLRDTFNGMPEVSIHDLHHKGDFADTSVEHVYRLVGEPFPRSATAIIAGVFPSVSERAHPNSQYFSLVHIDVDIYQSVKDCLEYFYPKMIPGGIIVLDDVLEPNCPGAKKAYEEFMADKPELPIAWSNICYSQVAFRKL